MKMNEIEKYHVFCVRDVYDKSNNYLESIPFSDFIVNACSKRDAVKKGEEKIDEIVEEILNELKIDEKDSQKNTIDVRISEVQDCNGLVIYRKRVLCYNYKLKNINFYRLGNNGVENE